MVPAKAGTIFFSQRTLHGDHSSQDHPSLCTIPQLFYNNDLFGQDLPVVREPGDISAGWEVTRTTGIYGHLLTAIQDRPVLFIDLSSTHVE